MFYIKKRGKENLQTEEEAEDGKKMLSDDDLKQISGGEVLFPIGGKPKRIKKLASRPICNPNAHELIPITKHQSYCRICGMIINY